jgi:hypothetical protein
VSRRGDQVLLLDDRCGGVADRPGERPADHVRGRRGARPVRTGPSASIWMAGQPAGPRGQRSVEPAAARRVRGAAGRGVPAPRPAVGDRRGHPSVPDPGRGRGGGQVAGAGPGHLGGAG